MKIPKRFALSTLLLVMLFVSLACGFVQWRRLRLIQEVKELTFIGNAKLPIAQGTHYISTFPPPVLNDGWWPTVAPQPTTICVKFDDFGQSVVVGGQKYSLDEAKNALSQLRRRLNAIGIDDVTIEVGMAIYDYDAAEQLKAVK